VNCCRCIRIYSPPLRHCDIACDGVQARHAVNSAEREDDYGVVHRHELEYQRPPATLAVLEWRPDAARPRRQYQLRSMTSDGPNS